MNKAHAALTFLLVASLGPACNDDALKSHGAGSGGQSSTLASGGSLGSGGSATGGAVVGGSGGNSQNSGGSAMGGTVGAGGIQALGGRAGSNGGGPASGGRGGSNAGGFASGGVTGAGGATCLPTPCIGIACPGGYVPNPDPCGCPICQAPDAGAGKDSAADTACIQPPCAAIKCKAGDLLVTPPCGCPTCVPGDAGVRDAIACPAIACLAVECTGGTLPNPDPCGCPICASPDAAAEKPQAACSNLDACACLKSDACSPIAEACYCPYPQCGSSGACICGGGKYLGCAPAGLATCAGAKAQVATLCPTLKGPTFDGICAGTNSLCVTKCFGEVTSCSDVLCSFCEACDCANDRFSQCVATCTSALAQK